MSLLPLLLLLLTLPAVVHAQFNYTTINGAFTITQYDCSSAAVTIPGTINGRAVTSIGENAFGACTRLTSVTIPNSVTSIGDYAFSGCTSLISVTIPNSVTSIGDYAFSGCTRLTSVTIPNSVTSIGDRAFSGCTRLSAITVEALNSVYSSIEGVLFNKSQTTLIQYPEGKAGSYTIPNSVTSIGDGAFSGCTSLISVTIPNSVTSIGDYAFSVCTSLTSVTIPNSVTSIRGSAFEACTSLTSVTIPNSVTSIGGSAFSGCTNLTSVTIPNSVTSIGDGAFSGCTRLSAITVEALNSVYSSIDGVLFNKSQTTLIRYPEGKAGSYTIPNSVTRIGSGAFSGCTSLISVTIPNSVRSIGDYAFYVCTSLTSVTIPNSVRSIGGYAFEACTSLTSVTIPNSVTSIGHVAFYSCTSLTSVTIPNSVTSIGGAAFASCASLTSVTIPNSVTSIGGEAFSGCTSLSAITVEALNSVYSSIDGVLFNKSQTTLIQYPGGKAGSYTIPNSVTNIWDSTFYGCTSLTSVTIPNSVRTIGGLAFYGCTSLTSVTIPNSVRSIGGLAFSGCTSLTAVYFKGNTLNLPGGQDVFFTSSDQAIVYYLPGTTGWGTTFAGRPTVLWNPVIAASEASFGVRTGQFGFTITGTSGLVIVVEASADLANPVWTPVGTNTLTGGSSSFSDPQSVNHPARFYRFRSP